MSPIIHLNFNRTAEVIQKTTNKIIFNINTIKDEVSLLEIAFI